MSKTNEDVLTIQLELGHQADFKREISPNGFTHDWSVFVRGQDGAPIQHFVEKVVFHLHETFKHPKRVILEPPYEVSESGYAGFVLAIEVYFKNKHVLHRKIKFEYDLFLNGEGAPPVNNCRFEKLKFRNPTEDFRQKLLKAGAVSSADSAAAAASQPFMDLFGPPIKTAVDSPKKSKHKDKEKSNKGKPSPSTSTSSLSEKDFKGDASSTPRTFSHGGKDISNSSSTARDTSTTHKDKDIVSAHKEKDSSSVQRDRDGDKHKESLSFNVKDKEREAPPVSHKSSSSSHKDGVKKTSSGTKESVPSSTPKPSSTPSSKSTSKDSAGSSRGPSKEGTSRKESIKEGHKKSHRDKDRSSREKESCSAPPKQSSEHTSPEQGSAVKKKKLDSGSSLSSKHHKSSKSEPVKPSSKEHSSKSSQKHESSRSHKPHKKDDVKTGTAVKTAGELEHKQSPFSKKSKDKSPPSFSHKPKSKQHSFSKKRHRSSSNSSDSSTVSTESSLNFTEDEDELKGPDIDSLMAELCNDSDDSKERSQPKSKASNSSHHLSSPSPSPPPRPSSKSSHRTESSGKCSSPTLSVPGKKGKKPSSPLVKGKDSGKDMTIAGAKPKDKGSKKKMEKIELPKKEARTPEPAKQKKTPPKKSPESASRPPPPLPPPPPQEKSKKQIIATKPTKMRKDSSEEEGEISSSSSSLSSDSEEENKKMEDVKSVHMHTDEEEEDKEEDVQNPAPEPVNGGSPPPQQNGKVWYPTDLADNGYTLGRLLKIQEQIARIEDADVLQEIADLMCEAGCLKFVDGDYTFDLCNLERELVDEVVEIMQAQLGELDIV